MNDILEMFGLSGEVKVFVTQDNCVGLTTDK